MKITILIIFFLLASYCIYAQGQPKKIYNIKDSSAVNINDTGRAIMNNASIDTSLNKSEKNNRLHLAPPKKGFPPIPIKKVPIKEDSKDTTNIIKEPKENGNKK